jgi:ribosomal protein L11 methyltransferase
VARLRAMSAAAWRAFRATLPEEQEELAVAALSDLAPAGFEADPARPGWSTLTAYFSDRPGLEPDVAAALAPLGLSASPAEVPEVDWVARVRQGFRPIDSGRFLIVPAWDVPRAPAGRTLLLVEPGHAFGTGTHETTRLCLAALEALASRRALGAVLDVGVGSGILAIAALRLGARLVLGVDNDPDAVGSAGAHARLNSVPLHLCVGDGARPAAPGRFDTLLANLMAPLLLARRDELAERCAPGAVLVLSGLLLEDLPAVREAYASLGEASERHDGEWAALVVALRA